MLADLRVSTLQLPDSGSHSCGRPGYGGTGGVEEVGVTRAEYRWNS